LIRHRQIFLSVVPYGAVGEVRDQVLARRSGTVAFMDGAPRRGRALGVLGVLGDDR